VAHRNKLAFHHRHDEVLVVVRGLSVHTPIALGDVPGLIDRVKHEVDKWLARGTPNEPHAREAAVMYRLRCLEQDQESLDLYALVET